MTSARVAVVGAGLAGLTCAVTAAQGGADVVLLEARDTPGGASLESAGWFWRYRDTASFARFAPGGDPTVQASVVDGLDPALTWLAAVTGEPEQVGTGRTFTVGARFEPRSVVAALVEQLPTDALCTGWRLAGIGRTSDDAFTLRAHDGRSVEVDRVVLATGGFAGDLDLVAATSGASAAAREAWLLRPLHGGDGSGQRAANEGLGVAVDPAGGACFVRVAPRLPGGARPDEDLLRAFGELTIPGTRLLDPDGLEVPRSADDWSGAAALWTMARTSGHGWLELPTDVLGELLHAGTPAIAIAAAERRGVLVERTPGALRVEIRTGITHTLGGIQVDARGAVQGCGSAGVAAAGCDARGSGLGGMASGLAQALVLGRAAGIDAASSTR